MHPQAYLLSRRHQGIADDQIASDLLSAGWSQESVARLLAPPTPPNSLKTPLSSGSLTEEEVNINQETKKLASRGTMWDTFQHIILFITLHALIVSTLIISYIAVDFFLPPLSRQITLSGKPA